MMHLACRGASRHAVRGMWQQWSARTQASASPMCRGAACRGGYVREVPGDVTASLSSTSLRAEMSTGLDT